jgi:hypothetical protein
LISHWEPAYSLFDVMIETPIGGISSMIRRIVGTQSFRTVLKM